MTRPGKAYLCLPTYTIQMTVTVAIRHEKAMQLLQNLADLNLMEFLSTDAATQPELFRRKLSSFIGQIETGQTLNQREDQLSHLRDEWERTV